jgi:hypothetical protein
MNGSRMKVGNLTWPYLGAPTAGPLLAASPPFVRQPLAQEKKPNIRMKREPREMGVVAGVVPFLLAAALAIAPAAAQVTGILGSPSATTTINGKQLPPPPSKFSGVIKESAKDSKPWWPPRVVPPKGAPNVLLIMTDDQGYGKWHVRRRHPATPTALQSAIRATVDKFGRLDVLHDKSAARPRVTGAAGGMPRAS